MAFDAGLALMFATSLGFTTPSAVQPRDEIDGQAAAHSGAGTEIELRQMLGADDWSPLPRIGGMEVGRSGEPLGMGAALR